MYIEAIKTKIETLRRCHVNGDVICQAGGRIKTGGNSQPYAGVGKGLLQNIVVFPICTLLFVAFMFDGFEERCALIRKRRAIVKKRFHLYIYYLISIYGAVGKEILWRAAFQAVLSNTKNAAVEAMLVCVKENFVLASHYSLGQRVKNPLSSPHLSLLFSLTSI